MNTSIISLRQMSAFTVAALAYASMVLFVVSLFLVRADMASAYVYGTKPGQDGTNQPVETESSGVKDSYSNTGYSPSYGTTLSPQILSNVKDALEGIRNAVSEKPASSNVAGTGGVVQMDSTKTDNVEDHTDQYREIITELLAQVAELQAKLKALQDQSDDDNDAEDTYDLGDIRSVVREKVGTPENDAGYYTYTIMLKNGMVHRIDVGQAFREQELRDTGYTGNIDALFALATDTEPKVRAEDSDGFAFLSVTPASGSAPLAVTFSGYAVTGSAFDRINIVFGDRGQDYFCGRGGTVQCTNRIYAAHIYKDTGTFTAHLVGVMHRSFEEARANNRSYSERLLDTVTVTVSE